MKGAPPELTGGSAALRPEYSRLTKPGLLTDLPAAKDSIRVIGECYFPHRNLSLVLGAHILKGIEHFPITRVLCASSSAKSL
jgi:hypothetical protein